MIDRLINRGPKAVALAVLRNIDRYWYLLSGVQYVTKNIHGYRMILDMEDPGISRSLMLYRERELETKKILEDLVRPGMMIYDIGANIGYYSNMFLWLADVKLVCVEPLWPNVLLTKKNLALNGYHTIPVIHAAVSNRKGESVFYVSDSSNLGTLNPNDSKFTHTLPTQLITLADIAAKYGKPDLIRMDVEGHEVEILSTLNKDLMPIVVFETHHDRYNAQHDMMTVMQDLFDLGYHVSTIATANPGITRRLIQLGSLPRTTIGTDATYRTFFKDVDNSIALDLICGRGGARTVVLQPIS